MASITKTEEANRIDDDDDSFGFEPIQFKLSELGREDDSAFDRFVRLNPELKVEQTSAGEFVVMSPTGGEGGRKNSKLTTQFGIWEESNGGFAFDSSTLFVLPNGAKRSPDVAWIDSARWKSLTKKQRKGYPPICPDMVVELRSETDRIIDIQRKMVEYIENGVRLGWIIDPRQKKVHVYRPGETPLVLSDPQSVSADSVMPGFTLQLGPIFES